MGQQQTLAPQMRQSLEILQATSLELQQMMAQAMEMNPVLEDLTEHDSFDEVLENEATDPDSTDDWLESYEDDRRDLAIMERRNTGHDHDAEERREHLYNSLVAPESLQAHLENQIYQAATEPQLSADARLLISNLDQRGYFDLPLAEIARNALIPITRLEDARLVIQSLDPAGVGASSLQECLILQLERRGDGLTLAADLMRDHLEELARNQFPQIAKSLKIPIDTVVEAAEIISRLDPAPGSSFDATSNPYIQPDVIFSKNFAGEWEASLTGSYLPKIRLNDHYKDLMAQVKTDAKTHSYLRDHLRDGRSLIKAIDQRQETILAISREILKWQHDFLEKGSRNLKPLTMNEVADAIGVHPTTVSRAVGGKYARTPWGLYELRKFFASGYHTDAGSDISNESVRKALHDMVNGENPSKPFSDEKLAEMLKGKGINVARRTVAKYREQIGILPSHLRKKY